MATNRDVVIVGNVNGHHSGCIYHEGGITNNHGRMPWMEHGIFPCDNGEEKMNEFKFPEKIPLEKRMCDVVEPVVDESFYLTENQIHNIEKWKAQQKPFKKVNGKNGVCQTLTARGAGEMHSGMVLYSDLLEDTTDLQNEPDKYRYRPRFITPLEAFRLMGFSDEDFAKAQEANPKKHVLYKQAGNSIVVNVIQGVIDALVKGEEYE